MPHQLCISATRVSSASSEAPFGLRDLLSLDCANPSPCITYSPVDMPHRLSCEMALVAEEGLLRAGAVSFAVLNFYINAMGGKLKFSLLMSWFLLVEAARVGATVWLSHWTDTVDAPGGAPHGPLWFLMIYTIISAVQVGLMKLASPAPA